MTHIPIPLKSVLIGLSIIALGACGESAMQSADVEPAAKPVEAEIIDAKVPNTIDVKIDHSDAEKAALALMAYQQGEWSSVWNMFDASGAQTAKFEGSVIFEELVDEYTQLMTYTIPGMNHKSVAIRGYNPQEGQIVSLNMARKGLYWELHQNPISGVTVSGAHLDADGVRAIRKFTRLAGDENSFGIQMHISLDDGATWFKRYDQFLKRNE